MIKSIYFPDRTFATKKDLFIALKENAKDIINLKKETVKFSDGLTLKVTELKGGATKGIDLDDNYSYHVINTTKFLDSHSDLHLDGIWDKSIVEKAGTILFIDNHNLAIKSIIAYPKDVDMSIMSLKWSDLGFDYDGETQGLVFKILKSDIQLKEATTVIEKGFDIEHSVRMQYVKIELAINDDGKEFKAEKKNYDKTIELVANKEKAIKDGFYWTVSEADIYKEGSMVISGSNSATPILTSIKSEPITKEIKKTFIYRGIV